MRGTTPALGLRAQGRPKITWLDNIRTWTGLSAYQVLRATMIGNNGKRESTVQPTLGMRMVKEVFTFKIKMQHKYAYFTCNIYVIKPDGSKSQWSVNSWIEVNQFTNIHGATIIMLRVWWITSDKQWYQLQLLEFKHWMNFKQVYIHSKFWLQAALFSSQFVSLNKMQEINFIT